jgi:hypothetical protein
MDQQPPCPRYLSVVVQQSVDVDSVGDVSSW